MWFAKDRSFGNIELVATYVLHFSSFFFIFLVSNLAGDKKAVCPDSLGFSYHSLFCCPYGHFDSILSDLSGFTDKGTEQQGKFQIM